MSNAQRSLFADHAVAGHVDAVDEAAQPPAIAARENSASASAPRADQRAAGGLLDRVHGNIAMPHGVAQRGHFRERRGNTNVRRGNSFFAKVGLRRCDHERARALLHANAMIKPATAHHDGHGKFAFWAANFPGADGDAV